MKIIRFVQNPVPVSYTHLDVYKRQIKDPVTDTIIPYPLPSNFSQETVPVSQTFSTWLEFDSLDELKNLPNSVMPVSYTHLDVYKRQGMSDSDNNLRNDHILNNCLLYTSRCV